MAALEDFLQGATQDIIPVTRGMLEGGARDSGGGRVPAASTGCKELRRSCLEVFKQAEVLVVPTMPTIPTLAEVQADSMGWSRRLGTYTNFVNLLGLAALAVPAGFTPARPARRDHADWRRRAANGAVRIGHGLAARLELPLGATG